MEGIPQEEKVKEKVMEKETKETATEIFLTLRSCVLLSSYNNRQKALSSAYLELLTLAQALLIRLLPHLHPPDPLLALLRLRQAMETHDNHALAAPLVSVNAALYPLHGRAV